MQNPNSNTPITPDTDPPHVRLTEAADRIERLLLSSIDAMESTPLPPTLAEINTASQALWRLTAVRKTLQNLATAATTAAASVPPEQPRGITEEEIQELLDRCSGQEKDDNYEELDDPEPDPAKNHTLARAADPPTPTPPSSSPSLSVKPISVPECPIIPALFSPTIKRIAAYTARTAKLLLSPIPFRSSRSRDPGKNSSLRHSPDPAPSYPPVLKPSLPPQQMFMVHSPP